MMKTSKRPSRFIATATPLLLAPPCSEEKGDHVAALGATSSAWDSPLGSTANTSSRPSLLRATVFLMRGTSMVALGQLSPDPLQTNSSLAQDQQISTPLCSLLRQVIDGYQGTALR